MSSDSQSTSRHCRFAARHPRFAAQWQVFMSGGKRRISWPARIITILVCLFLAFCAAVTPIYSRGGSIVDFSYPNALIFIAAFVIYDFLIAAGTRLADRLPALRRTAEAQRIDAISADSVSSADSTEAAGSNATNRSRASRRWKINDLLYRHSTSFRGLFLVFIVGWIWVPLIITLSFGVDPMHQIVEVEEWLRGSAAGDFSVPGFTELDFYPIAHYLLPNHPVFLSNQHNLFLTLFYGLTAVGSQKLFGTKVPGLILLSVLQYMFAVLCTASTLNRFLRCAPHKPSRRSTLLTMWILLLSPMVSLSTIALTKTPLFAFASLWWISLLYEVVHPARQIKESHESDSSTAPSCASSASAGKFSRRFSRGFYWELALSTLIMLISAKYALYIVVIEFVVLLCAHWRNWKAWIVGLLLPTLLFTGALHAAYSTGQVVDGDSIESKAIQIQQIARIYRDDPQAVPESATKQLSKIFNLQNMAQQYFQTDADRVKSTGPDTKPVTYKWKTVTRADWKQFNHAWFEAVKAAPVPAFDAFVAEFYGYFSVLDMPTYAEISYYSANDTIDEAVGIKGYSYWGIRGAIVGFIQFLERIPVIGWPLRGNFWVTLTLLLICIQLRRRQWKDLLWTLPLLVQMGVMIASPANNFERHMICVAATAPMAITATFNDDDGASTDLSPSCASDVAA